VVTEAALARYPRSNRWDENTDGRHVDSERWLSGRHRIRNLSPRQRKLIGPKLDLSQFSC